MASIIYFIMVEVKVFDSPTLIAKESAKLSLDILKSAIGQRGYAVWILAGGTTPLLAYKEISDKYIKDLDWRRVYFLIGDERSVAIDSPESNYRLINEALLSKVDLDRDKLILPRYSEDNISDADTYNLAVAKMFSNLGPEVDLLWLGMGEDGHTLSLFPGHQEINNQSRYVLPVNNAPKPPLERITLGLKALSEVKHCQVLASGSLKKDA